MADIVLTATDVFGATPWFSNPTGTGPLGDFNLNPLYFATPQTADKVASILGGTVVAVDVFAATPNNPFKQNQLTYAVQLAPGVLVNAGVVAGFFTHGFSLSMVKNMLVNEVVNVFKETTGQVVEPDKVTINLQAPPTPVPTAPSKAVGFVNYHPDADPPFYEMLNPIMAMNGVVMQGPDGKDYLGSVTKNPFLGSVIGRWTLVG